jgi:hypothetical protein
LLNLREGREGGREGGRKGAHVRLAFEEIVTSLSSHPSLPPSLLSLPIKRHGTILFLEHRHVRLNHSEQALQVSFVLMQEGSDRPSTQCLLPSFPSFPSSSSSSSSSSFSY